MEITIEFNRPRVISPWVAYYAGPSATAARLGRLGGCVAYNQNLVGAIEEAVRLYLGRRRW